MGSLAEDLRRVDREITFCKMHPQWEDRRRKQKEYTLVLLKNNGEEYSHTIIAYNDDEAINLAFLAIDMYRDDPKKKNFKKCAKALICDGRVVYPPKQ